MDNWKIDNHSNRKFLIQKNEGELSIVEPLDNGAFKIPVSYTHLRAHET